MASNTYITTYSPAGYSLAANTNLYITSTGGFGPTGIYAAFSTITTEGRVNGGAKADGVEFNNGGSLKNGSLTYGSALVEGRYGILFGAAGSVTNFGSIEGISSFYGSGDGVSLLDGGGVTNGLANDRTALIEGYQGVYADGAAGSRRQFRNHRRRKQCLRGQVESRRRGDQRERRRHRSPDGERGRRLSQWWRRRH